MWDPRDGDEPCPVRTHGSRAHAEPRSAYGDHAVVHLALGLAAVYVTLVSGMYFAQTWLLFPTQLAEAARARLPPSAQRLEVATPAGAAHET